MRFPWDRSNGDEKPNVEQARRKLDAVRKHRSEVEDMAARLRWHLAENDFRRKALGLLREDQ